LKIGLVIFIILITIFLFYYFTIYPRQKQNKIDTSDLKTKCDIESIKIFNNTTRNVNSINYTYKNHYISNLKRCYILIHGIGVGETGLSDKLINVFENKRIAECESYATAPEIDFCSYDGSDKLEYNIDQFNGFVKPYMEN
jgi:hypothetical protein